MMKTIRIRGAAACACLLLVLWACADRQVDVLAPENSLLATITRVELTPTLDTLNALGGDTLTLTAKAYDAGNNEVPATFTFKAIDTLIATIDANGLVTTNAARGNARFTAKTNGITGSAKVLVRQIIKDVQLMPAVDTLNFLGASVQLFTVPIDSNNVAVEGATLTYKSLDPAYASISNTGNVVAVKVRTAPARLMVTASGVRIGTRKDTSFIVIRQVPETFTTPRDTINAIRDTIQLSAVVLDSNGQPIPITYRSLHRDFVRVNASGKAWSLASGLAEIELTAGGEVDTMSVLSRQVLNTVEVTHARDTLLVGDTMTVTGIARDSNNYVIPGQTFNWSVLDVGRASINPSSGSATTLMTALSGGTARVRATRNLKYATALITVELADGATHTWTGSAGTTWATPDNWSPAFKPVSADTAVVAPAANQPVLSGSTAITRLRVQSGATVDLGSFILSLSESLLVSGEMFMSTGYTRLLGSGSIQGLVSKLSVLGTYSVAVSTEVKRMLEIKGGTLETLGNPIVIRGQ